MTVLALLALAVAAAAPAGSRPKRLPPAAKSAEPSAAPLHNGPQRAARRRAVHAALRAGRQAASSAGLPPLPPHDGQQAQSNKQRMPRAASQRAATRAEVAAAMPQAATKLPDFADLYVQSKAKQVAPILQLLVKVSSAIFGASCL